MNLYGHEMDETISPYECGMAWTLALKDDRDFVGRTAMQAKQQQAVGRGDDVMQVGLVLESRGVLRDGMTVTLDNGKNWGDHQRNFFTKFKTIYCNCPYPKNTRQRCHC